MKIAVTSKGFDLFSEVDERFGRAENFLIINCEDMSFEAIKNVQNMNAAQGAGLQASKTIINNGVSALLTGSCGPKAFNVLKQANIKVFVNVKGKIEDAVKKFLNQEFEEAKTPNAMGH